MKLVLIEDPKKIDRLPDKTIVLLSNARYKEHVIVRHVELRLYQKRMGDRGPYSIVTSFIETEDGDTIEDVVVEGYKGPNILEEISAYITSHLTLSNLILRAVEKLLLAKESESEKDHKSKIDEMIKTMKQRGFLTRADVEDAIIKTPRHLFVSENLAKNAYYDGPLPTKKCQTISQPSVVARMTEWLDVREDHKVLEIGSGSGWQSAILSVLVGNGKIYTIERCKELVYFAKQNHEKAGIKNVEVIFGDGTLGLPEKAPFDRIIVTAACEKVPPPLLDQLSLDGLLIAPVGGFWQSLTLLKKTSKGIKELKKEFGYIFAPLIGKYGQKEDVSLS